MSKVVCMGKSRKCEQFWAQDNTAEDENYKLISKKANEFYNSFCYKMSHCK